MEPRSGLGTDSVYENVAQVAQCQYRHVGYNKDLLGMLYRRQAHDEDVYLPTGDRPNEWVYWGAHVFDPVPGLNENVVYVDLASLYPNLMRALNASPETLIGTAEALADSEYSEEDCVWGYIDPRPVKHVSSDERWQDYVGENFKQIYDDDASAVRWRDPEGPTYEKCYFLAPEVRAGMVTEQVQELIDLKYEYEGSLYEAVKRVVNSQYGFLGFGTQYSSSPLYDWRLAEAITLCGRVVIQHTAQQVVEYLEERVDGDVYVALGDTDGAGICWPEAPSRTVMMEYVADAVAYLNETGYAEFCTEQFGVDADSHYMEVEVESYAPRVYVPAEDYDTPDPSEGVKKRYGQWVTVDEGESVDDLSITGLEATRSDVAQVTVDAQEHFFKTLLRSGHVEAEQSIFRDLRDRYERIQNGEYPLADIAKRRGIGQSLDEYGGLEHTPAPFYRGAKYASEHVDGVHLTEGSKPLLYYVKRAPPGHPRTYTADTAEDGDPVDAITVPEPSDLPEGTRIDWAKHCEKTLVDPMEPHLETMGWSWDGVVHEHEQSGLSSFM